jgi:hypothetical protein
MSKKPYIPNKDSELGPWARNLVSVILAHEAIWGIPSEEIRAIQEELQTYYALYEACSTPARTSIIVAQKNESRKRLVSLICGMVDFRLKNSIITDDQLIEMGLPVRDKIPTPIPVPSKSPIVIVKIIGRLLLEIIFYSQDAIRKAKPYGCNGAVIAYAILDNPPRNQEELTHTVLATKTPTLWNLKNRKEEKRFILPCAGKILKDNGQWSEIISTIIP